MCIIVADAGYSHFWNQFFAGVLFGCTSGYLHQIGFFALSNLISTLLLILTILDHLGVVLMPWGYRGPGTEPGRFRGPMTLNQLGYEFFSFLLNNVLLYVTYIFCYAVASGHLQFTKEGRVIWI